jgi:hypothetical protein
MTGPGLGSMTVWTTPQGRADTEKSPRRRQLGSCIFGMKWAISSWPRRGGEFHNESLLGFPVPRSRRLIVAPSVPGRRCV